MRFLDPGSRTRCGAFAVAAAMLLLQMPARAAPPEEAVTRVSSKAAPVPAARFQVSAAPHALYAVWLGPEGGPPLELVAAGVMDATGAARFEVPAPEFLAPSVRSLSLWLAVDSQAEAVRPDLERIREPLSASVSPIAGPEGRIARIRATLRGEPGSVASLEFVDESGSPVRDPAGPLSGARFALGRAESASWSVEVPAGAAGTRLIAGPGSCPGEPFPVRPLATAYEVRRSVAPCAPRDLIDGICYLAAIGASVWPIGTAIAGPTALGCAIMYTVEPSAASHP